MTHSPTSHLLASAGLCPRQLFSVVFPSWGQCTPDCVQTCPWVGSLHSDSPYPPILQPWLSRARETVNCYLETVDQSTLWACPPPSGCSYIFYNKICTPALGKWPPPLPSWLFPGHSPSPLRYTLVFSLHFYSFFLSVSFLADSFDNKFRTLYPFV